MRYLPRVILQDKYQLRVLAKKDLERNCRVGNVNRKKIPARVFLISFR